MQGVGWVPSIDLGGDRVHGVAVCVWGGVTSIKVSGDRSAGSVEGHTYRTGW